MPIADLASLYQQLPFPDEGESSIGLIRAIPIPGATRHRLGRRGDDTSALLVDVRDRQDGHYAPPIVLEHLTVHHDVECHIIGDDSAVEVARFTVISCTSRNVGLRSYFLRASGAFLEAVGDSPTRQEVVRALDAFVELFRALSNPPKKSVQGLWAELFLIARSKDPITLAEAWHAQPMETFDFAAGSDRIEVKSSSDRVRRHYFSLEQIRPNASVSVVVASLFVERAGMGLSLGGLLDDVRQKLGTRPDLLLNAEVVVGRTLGNALPRALGESFDVQLAEASLGFYRADDIPSVATPLPSGVSDVRFRADLSNLEPLNPTGIIRGTLFHAATLAR